MSTLPSKEPLAAEVQTNAVELVIEARPRDLGGFTVRRALPSSQRRLIGPFIFFDQMGPALMPPGQGIDVRPHPHVALATLTYLYDGEIVHRDSLGSHQPIRPGDVNWMLAGRGIVHSERSSAEWRRAGGQIHGIQCWLALPRAREDSPPSFEHHPQAAIPAVERPGARLRVVAGTAYGRTSPVTVASPTLYVDARLENGAALPLPDEHAARAAYVAEGTVACDGKSFAAGAMIVFREGKPATLHAPSAARVMLLGGAPLDGERFIWWNLVASSQAQMDEAKRDWRVRNQARFPKVPGDDVEFIPAPADS